jgi:hypothetical protein
MIFLLLAFALLAACASGDPIPFNHTYHYPNRWIHVLVIPAYESGTIAYNVHSTNVHSTNVKIRACWVQAYSNCAAGTLQRCDFGESTFLTGAITYPDSTGAARELCIHIGGSARGTHLDGTITASAQLDTDPVAVAGAEALSAAQIALIASCAVIAVIGIMVFTAFCTRLYLRASSSVCREWRALETVGSERRRRSRQQRTRRRRRRRPAARMLIAASSEGHVIPLVRPNFVNP